METGKNFKKRSTIAGKPLYLTKDEGNHTENPSHQARENNC